MIPLAGRHLTSELRANGTVLPAGTDVTPAIWLTHTSPESYPEPYAFRPERFLGSAPPTYAWIPFGGGVRRCLGAAFATMEMAEVLRIVAERLDVAPADVRGERMRRRGITLQPGRGARVVLSDASSASSS